MIGMSNKRAYDSDSQSSHSSHKRCNTIEGREPKITIDHTRHVDYDSHQRELRGATLGDNQTDIKFVVEGVEIQAHRPVIEILKNKRQLVRDAIERDRRSAQNENAEAATIFQMSGTTPTAFKKLLDYIYTGIVECDLKTGVELATTAHKLKFHPLVASLAQQLALHKKYCLTLESVDELYYIGKCSDNKELQKICSKFLDEKAYDLNSLFMKRDRLSIDSNKELVFKFDKTRFINYIEFLIPEKYSICFRLSISSDRTNWTVVLNNDEIWSKFWNWVYFREQRIKFIKITFTDLKNGQQFDTREIRDDHFVCKRANVELQFDDFTGYLIPKHDVIKFPIRDQKYYFDKNNKSLFTYCMSKSSVKHKRKDYFYHNVGDNKFLEFYLSQTCLIDNFRLWLWDEDQRTYDFKVEVKSENEEEFTLIPDQTSSVFRNKSSWQTIDLRGRRAVRWIKITGIRGPPHDTEFAVIDIEVPAINKK